MGNFITRNKVEIQPTKLKKRPGISRQYTKTIYQEYLNNPDVITLEPEHVNRIHNDYLTYKGKNYRIYHD